MSAITDDANDTFRDYVVAATPSSGAHEPVKADIRAWGALIDVTLTSAITGTVIGTAVTYATQAELYADLAHAAGVLGVVYDDATAANNGIYVKSGASGAGAWTITDLALPSTFAADLATVLAQLATIDADVAATAADRVATAADVVAAQTASDLAQGYAADAATVSGVNVPIYASVATAQSATIAAGVKGIEIQFYSPTYSSVATLVGRAHYSRVSLADITAAAYPALAYFRSTDRYMPDGTTDATNGGYWLLAVDTVTPLMLGAAGDGTDDTTALDAANSGAWDAIDLAGREYGYTGTFVPACHFVNGVITDTTRRHDFNLARIADQARPADPAVIDLHFGAMKGTGWNSTIPEGGGTLTTTTTAAAAIGDRDVLLTSATSFYANMLIVYLSSDGEYYTATIKSIAANTLTLKQPLEAAIASGGTVSNFFNDQAHPNVNGYYAIVDYALRGLKTRKQLAYKWISTDVYTPVGSPTLSTNATNSYDNPGSTLTPARKAVATIALDGIETPNVYLLAGAYIARATLTANTEAASADTVTTRLSVLENSSTIAYVDSSSRSAQSLDIPFFAQADKPVKVRVSANAIGTGFAVASLEIFRVLNYSPAISDGRIVVLGDSWVSQAHFTTRLAARLPDSTIINAGVGGNTTTQMIARYANDVAAYYPDIVFNLGATNDAAQAVSTATYSSNIASLARLAGAALSSSIFFNAPTCADAHTTEGDLLTPTRDYVLNNSMGTKAPVVTGATQTQRFGVSRIIPNSTTKVIALLSATTRGKLTIKRAYVTGLTGNMTYGFGSSMGSTAEDSGTLALASIHTNVAVAKPTNTSARWFAITVTNSSGSDAEIIGQFEIEWTPA